MTKSGTATTATNAMTRTTIIKDIYGNDNQDGGGEKNNENHDYDYKETMMDDGFEDGDDDDDRMIRSMT